MRHTINTEDFNGIYEHTSVFASSSGGSQSKRINATLIYNWDTDKTSFVYRVINNGTVIFENTSLQKAIAKYNEV